MGFQDRLQWSVENLVAQLPDDLIENLSHREFYMALGSAKTRFRDSK